MQSVHLGLQCNKSGFKVYNKSQSTIKSASEQISLLNRLLGVGTRAPPVSARKHAEGCGAQRRAICERISNANEINKSQVY